MEPVLWALVRSVGHGSARGTPAYVPVRLETALTAAIYGTVQLQPMQWARLRQVEDERLYISTVPALEAELLPDP